MYKLCLIDVTLIMAICLAYYIIGVWEKKEENGTVGPE